MKWRNNVVQSVSLVAQVKEIVKDQNNLVVAVISDGSASIILQHFLSNGEESNVREINAWLYISGKIGVISKDDNKIFSVTAWGGTVRKIIHPMELVQGRMLALSNLLDHEKGYYDEDNDINNRNTENNQVNNNISISNINKDYSNIQKSIPELKIQNTNNNSNNSLEDTIKEILQTSAEGITRRELINTAMTAHRGFNPAMIIKMVDNLEERGETYKFDDLYYSTS